MRQSHHSYQGWKLLMCSIPAVMLCLIWRGLTAKLLLMRLDASEIQNIFGENHIYIGGGYDMEYRLQFHLFAFLLKWWFISLFWLHISALCSLYGNFSWGCHGASFKAGRYQWMCRGVRSLTLRSPVSNSDLSGSAGDLESLASFFWTWLVQRRHRWGAVPWQPKVSFPGWMHFSFYDWNMLKRNG